MMQCGRTYDLTLASGVLYHSADPVHLIDLIAKSSNTFFIWTHYFAETLKDPADLRGVPFSGRVKKQDFAGLNLQLHERHYYKAWRSAKFCGGLQDLHYWMTVEDILSLIDVLGFDCVTAHDDPNHVNGPCISIFARRRA
jgi:hypothetical protein